MTQPFAPLALGQHMDVVSRAAALTAIERVGLPVLLGQCGFHKGGGGPQQGRDPHPEHRTGTTGRHCRHHAHQIAHAHPGGGGDGPASGRRKGRSCLAFSRTRRRSYPGTAARQKTGAAGEPDARREQQHHHEGNADAAAQRDGEQVAPQQAIDGFDKIYQQGRFLL